MGYPVFRGMCYEGVSSAANRLTFAAPCFMIYLSLEATNPTARKGQANKVKQYNRIRTESRLSHAPKPSTGNRRNTLGAADSRDFSFQWSEVAGQQPWYPPPNGKETTAMNEHTSTPTLEQAEQYYCVVCGSPVIAAEQEDYRVGFEGKTYTILTCPQSPAKCKIGQATASLRRLESGEFQLQWHVTNHFDLHTGEAA